MATEKQKAEYAENGFTIVRQLLSPTESDDLLRHLREAQRRVIAGSRLDKAGLAFRHNLYKVSPELRAFVSQKKIIHFLRDIVGPDIFIRWDQTVEKAPGGGEFPWHQDNGYNGLLDAHFQLWVSLSEMTPENGGLWLQRGSHKAGARKHQVVENHLSCAGDERTAEFIRAGVGDAVLFSSMILHRTSPNVTDNARLAYVIEYMSLRHYDPYIPAPYFVVARGGEPCSEFVRFYPGRLSATNQLKYFPPRTRRALRAVRVWVAGALKGATLPGV